MSLNKNFIFAVNVATLLSFMWSPLTGHHITISGYLLLIVACYPFMYKSNVYSLFGGFAPDGDVTSLFGVVQVAKERAFSCFGISILQKGNWVLQVIGISFFQIADDTAIGGVGIYLVQKGHDVHQLVGISAVQIAQDFAEQTIGFVLFQKGRRIKDRMANIHVFRKWVNQPPTEESSATHTFGVR